MLFVTREGEGFMSIETTFFLIVFILINAFASFSRETSERNEFNLKVLAEQEIDRTEKLLNQLMPPYVLSILMKD